MFEVKTNLTCPNCNETTALEMPTSYCQIVYECKLCGFRITPKDGDCCIFCSYADKKCPVMQKQDKRFQNVKLKAFNWKKKLKDGDKTWQ